MTVHSYKDLDVWKKSMRLVTDVCELTKSFPREELYGLTSQVRRSAVSVPSNIAEGRGKRSTGDFIRYLNIAYGSLAELETQILIAENLQYTTEKTTLGFIEKIGEINRMLNGMISKLDKRLSLNAKC